MATIILQTAGAALGGFLGGPIGSAIGRLVGGVAGSFIDNLLFGGGGTKQYLEGPRLTDSQIMTSVEGSTVTRVYGRVRVAGQIIWASRLREEITKDKQSSGGAKGGSGGKSTTVTTTYNYYANIAVGICEGEISHIGRVWADGKEIDLSEYTHRVYTGTETQTPDALIEAKEGDGNVPGYRGLAYVVFEDMLLEKFGNRVPQLLFEVFRPVVSDDSVEPLIMGVNLIPGTTEFGYDPEIVRRVVSTSGGTATAEQRENNHLNNGKSDWENSLDQLEATLTGCETVCLVVTWFGDDLRAGNCTIKPRVETATKDTTPHSWVVAGLTRGTATLVSTISGEAAFGGTPSDASVIRAIQDLSARGFRVMFYPFIIMDVPSGNTKQNPYTGFGSQPVYPWRGRITCDPAPLAQNLLLNTDDLSSWTTSAASKTAGQSDVFGSTDGVDITDTSSGAQGQINSDIITDPSIGTRVFFSVYIEVDTTDTHYPEMRCWLDTVSGSFFYLRLNPSNGNVNESDSADTTVHSYGADLVSVSGTTRWYRLWAIASDSVNSLSMRMRLYPSVGGTSAFPSGSNTPTATGRFCAPQIALSSVKVDYYRNTTGSSVSRIDKTAAVATQVDSFYGTADAADFGGSGTTVTYTGPAEWTYSRFVLHMAQLCKLAGGVDYFCVGSELVGLTQLRDSATNYPFVDKLVTLAAEVTTLLPTTLIGYAADWSEYNTHRPGDGSGDVFFHLDPLWTSANIDFIGIDNYMKLSDWRDGTSHLDYLAGNPSVYDIDYLKSNIEGGEDYDWYYASQSDRDTQTRTNITDGEYNRPWVYRQKDIKSWWQNSHYNRPAGFIAENLLIDTDDLSGWSGAATVTAAYGSDPLGGTASILVSDASASTVVKNSNSANTLPAGGTAVFSCYAKKNALATHYASFRVASVAVDTTERIDGLFKLSDGTLNVIVTGTNWTVVSSGVVAVDADWVRVYIIATNSVGMSDLRARVFPGHNTNGTATATASVTGDIEIFGPMLTKSFSVLTEFSPNTTSSPVVAVSTGWIPQSKPVIFTEIGCPAVDLGSNQPNVFYDPKSSESFVPHYSTGARDDVIQRQFLRAHFEYWDDVANNPVSSVYTDSMIDISNSCVWSWDARPWPTFPAEQSLWADADNWLYGHWLNSRMGTVYVPDLLAMIAEEYGFTSHDFSRAYGTSAGFIIDRVMSFRDASRFLELLHHFDIIESGSQVKAATRHETLSVATLTADNSVISDRNEIVRLTRRQETELPAAVSMQYVDHIRDYKQATVQARRLTGSAESVSISSIPVVTDYNSAQQSVDTLLFSAWAEREKASLSVLPQLLKLEPGDTVTISIGSFAMDVRLTGVNDGLSRSLEGVSFDRRALRPEPAASRSSPVTITDVGAAPLLYFMDIPLLFEEDSPQSAYVAAHASPWSGGVSVYRSRGTSNYQLNTVLVAPATIGETLTSLAAGPEGRWDRANTVDVELFTGSLASASEDDVLDGANAVAVQNSTGGWEILQFTTATLIGTRQYRLSNLLRAQLGTEGQMEASLAAGATIIVLDLSIKQLTMSVNEIGLAYNYKYGPSTKPISDAQYTLVSEMMTGVGYRPYSVVDISGALSGSDRVIAWTRRTRIGGDSWEYTTDVPLAETDESYEVDVLNPSDVVVRTIGVTTTSATYTSAQMSSDGIVAPFDVIVYQISSVFGRGTGRRATIS